MHALVEIIITAFPMTVIVTAAGAIAGGLVFGPIGAGIGAVLGLGTGAALEGWLQRRLSAMARVKWAGFGVVVGLLLTIAVTAVMTR